MNRFAFVLLTFVTLYFGGCGAGREDLDKVEPSTLYAVTKDAPKTANHILGLWAFREDARKDVRVLIGEDQVLFSRRCLNAEGNLEYLKVVVRATIANHQFKLLEAKKAQLPNTTCAVETKMVDYAVKLNGFEARLEGKGDLSTAILDKLRD